jgi:1-acyl-sn-glycerol-3-phosphate acyltransferase
MLRSPVETGTLKSVGTVSRDGFAEQVAALLADWGADSAESLRGMVRALLDEFDEPQLVEFERRVATTGGDWGYHPPDPVARSISRSIMSHVLLEGSGLDDAGALEAARSSRAMLMGNHLSFVDVNVLDYLIDRAGYGDVAERVTALVGPKVFELPIRRLASLCFGTIKLAQSSSRASGAALMRPREVAKLARNTIAAALERQQRGDLLLVFPEGSRSRSGGLERCLAAVARYLDGKDVVLIPWGHSGSERLVPLDEDRVQPSRVRVRIGPAIPAASVVEVCSGRRQLVMDTVGFLIAGQLPESYRGCYGTGDGELAEAREIAAGLLG